MSTFVSSALAIALIFAFIFEAYRYGKARTGMEPASPSLPVAEQTGEVTTHVRTVEAAHAARARKKIPIPVHEILIPDIVRDMFNEEIDTTSKYIGMVSGSSCVRFGFKNGDLFLGDRPEDGATVEDGDFVVVGGPAAGSNVARRIRRIAHIDGDNIEFEPDENGKPHRARDRNTVIAKITHILA